MVKKRKKKKDTGYDPSYWNKQYLKEIQTTGKFMGTTQRQFPSGIGTMKMQKTRYRKFRVPKWIYKIKGKWRLNDYVRFHETNLRFPNNEERILAVVSENLRRTIKDISNETAIDYRNISRYLKEMEKKGLIKFEPDTKYKYTKSGRLKSYHSKQAKITKEGKELYIKLYKW